MKWTSAIFTSLSGKLGGAVATKSRGGQNNLRSLVIPSNPRTFAQSRMRLILASLAAAWRGTLTSTQVLAWDALATGPDSGIDVYVRVNSQIILAESPRVDAAPVSPTFAADPLTGIGADASAMTALFSNTTFNDDYFVNVFASVHKQHFSRLSQQFPFTFVGTVQLDGAANNTIDLVPIYGAAGLVAGDIIYLRFVQLDINGRVAIPQEGRVVVVA